MNVKKGNIQVNANLQYGDRNAVVSMNQETSDALFMKIRWRLIPLLFFCYIIAYVDRINIGFAKLQLREVLGVNEAVFGSIYGIGAGLFFIGYFLFEIPSNLLLQRVGARLWIARIMIIWGFVTVTMMFIHSTKTFYFLRFLLGVAEAGFFPGVILYLTYWFPARERARTVALFATGGVIAGIVGSPLSGAILGLHDKAGLAGWQWLFLLEGIPAVLIGFVVLFILPTGPQKVHWLNDNEKQWIQFRLNEDKLNSTERTHYRLSEVFTDKRIWLLCLAYFLLNVGGYGFEMWLPSIVKGFTRMSYSAVGFINAIPYLGAVIAMLITGYFSDKTGERRWFVTIAAFVSAIGFVLASYLHNPFFAMVALTIAFVGLKSAVGPLWAMGTTFITGTAAAGGIALINSVGNLGGFVGPTLVGVLNDRTGNNNLSMWLLGGSLFFMGVVVLTIRKHRRQAIKD